MFNFVFKSDPGVTMEVTPGAKEILQTQAIEILKSCPASISDDSTIIIDMKTNGSRGGISMGFMINPKSMLSFDVRMNEWEPVEIADVSAGLMPEGVIVFNREELSFLLISKVEFDKMYNIFKNAQS